MVNKNNEIHSRPADCFDAWEVANKLGYKSNESVFQMIYANLFPNAYKLKNKWWIPVSDFEAYEKLIGNCLDTEELAKRLGYKSGENVLHLIKLDKFPNAFKIRSKWWIPLNDVDVYENEELIHYKVIELSGKKEIKALDIVETAVRLNRNTFNIYDLIKKNKLPNAYKHRGKWWIPIQDVESYEKILQHSVDCLTTQQAASRLGYTTHSYIITLLQKNMFPNAFKNDSGEWMIPIGDIESLEQPKNFLNTKEAANKLGLKSTNAILYLITNNKFPNAIQDLRTKRWLIPTNEIEYYEHKSPRPKSDKENCKNSSNSEEWLTTHQIAERLGYKSITPIRLLIRNNKFPNAIKAEQWWVPIKDVEEYEHEVKETLNPTQLSPMLGYKTTGSVFKLINKNMFPIAIKDKSGRWRIPLKDYKAFQNKFNKEHCIGIKDVASKLGLKSECSVKNLIENNRFPNAFRLSRRWWIPISDVEAYKQLVNPEDSLNVTDTAIKLGLTRNSIYKLLKNSTFPNAFKSSNSWLIPITDIIAFQDSINTGQKDKDSSLSDCITIKELKDRLNLTESTIKTLIHQNQLKNAFKYKRKWRIPLKDVIEYEESKLKELGHPPDYLTTHEAAKRLGYSNSNSINQLIIKSNKFPNAYKHEGKWRIPIIDIKQFELSVQQANQKIAYTAKEAFKDLVEFLDSVLIGKNLLNTKQLFKDYCLLQTNNMQGTDRYRRDRVLQFQRFYKMLVDAIDKEVFLLSSSEIEPLLGDSSSFPKEQKILFTRFLNYTYSIKNIKPDEEFVIHRNRNNNEKDIYSPVQFYKLYEYVKNVKAHTPIAIRDRYYANMWVYTILLLTDFIRGQDLIKKTPNIDLEEININSFDWFQKNELSEYQAQLVVNQLYIHFRHNRTNKTDELLTFIVAPDLIYPLAVALVLSELHREIENSEILLDTFLEGGYSNIITYGKSRHRKFFSQNQSFNDFQFSSQKMNRSVSTYLFYAITEEDGYDSELALHLTQNARSHKRPNTTSEYIQSTNKDGSINRVSYNLFRRGLFGWLYNYLILFASKDRTVNNTLEERTQLIEGIRKDISPSGLENIARFVANHITLTPLKKDSNNMDEYLNIIYEKRRSLISKLMDYPKEEIQKILLNLALGKMPSKNVHAQCLLFPNCKYPGLSNCYSCEYVIPGNLLLIQLKEELNRLIESIDSNSNEILIKKDSKFLLSALFLWKEARLSFGNERVEAFIPATDTWMKIENLAHKLYLD